MTRPRRCPNPGTACGHDGRHTTLAVTRLTRTEQQANPCGSTP
jgi:hypothetical protein